MTIITTGRHVVLGTTQHSVEDELVIVCLVLVLDYHQVSTSAVIRICDVVPWAAE